MVTSSLDISFGEIRQRYMLCLMMCLCIGLLGAFSVTAQAKPATAQAKPAPAQAKTVYEKQEPITDKELVSFMEILPHFRAWAASSGEEAHPTVTKAGKPDFVYSNKAAEWVKARDWDPVRFFSVMGRAAAALAIVEEGNDMVTKKPTDMPKVTESELDLVRRHLASLLRAGNDAPPIKR